MANLLQLINLEIWGVPTGGPAFDRNNHSFIYLRWQRGVLQYDASCGCIKGGLLADYLKAILTGQNRPADLTSEAAAGPLLRQYDPTAPHSVARPVPLPNTDMTNAITPEAGG